MPATPHRALPFPAGADVPDVPLWLQALGVALDFDMFVITDAVRPAAGTLSRVHRNPATGAWSLDTGAAWVDLPIGGPYLPIAGGALTGDLDLGGHHLVGAIRDEHRDKVTTVGAAGAARTLDAAVSPIHDVLLDQNVTFTFSGVDGDFLTLILRQPAAVKTVAWPATVDWADGLAPEQSALEVIVYRFVRINGRWLGLVFGNTPPWIAVGGGGGAPAFQNAWVNQGGNFQTVRFRKLRADIVELEGCMKTGASGAIAFTLPVGYRPSLWSNRLAFATGGAAVVTILNDGTVTPANLTAGTNVSSNVDFGHMLIAIG